MSTSIRPEISQLHIPNLVAPPHRHALHQNVSPFDYPDALKAEVMARVATRSWASYQEPYPTTLLNRLAEHLNLSPDMLLVGNGSSDLIYVVLSALLGRGDHMVLNMPNFIRHQLIGRGTGAMVHMVSSKAEDGFALPVDELLRVAEIHQARLIALCSPNNPTGQTFAAEEIRRLAMESNAVILIDAAYEEFSDQDTRSLPHEFANVIILRTFSKAMNMAGLRVGYAMMHPALAREVEKAKLHYVPNLFSETAAIVALENYAHFQAQIDAVKAERTRVYTALTGLTHLQIFPSTANFFLMRFTQPSTTVFNHLLDEYGILTKDLGKAPQLANHLCISLGTPTQNDLLIHALRSLSIDDSMAVDTTDAKAKALVPVLT